MKYFRLIPTANGRIEECTMLEWAHNLEKHKLFYDEPVLDQIRVSTVFLGFDHRFGEGPPLLFETMVFGGRDDGFQLRCCTYDQAVAMHAATLKWNRRRWYKPWTWFYKEPRTNYDTGELE